MTNVTLDSIENFEQDSEDYIFFIPKYILMHKDLTLLDIKIYALVVSSDNSLSSSSYDLGYSYEELIQSLNKLVQLDLIEKNPLKDIGGH